MNKNIIQPVCIGCNKKPEDIAEYRHMADINDLTPTQFIIIHEGTYHMFEAHKFYCTSCYIKAGMPAYLVRH